MTEDKITKVVESKQEGWKYYTKEKFYPLDAEDVDSNTKDMEEAEGKGYILTSEMFGLTSKIRAFAERWVAWANENKDKATSILEDVEDGLDR